MKGQQKTLLEGPNQSKFYSGDCYIFQYSYPGEDREEYLIGTWFGKQSVEVIFGCLIMLVLFPFTNIIVLMYYDNFSHSFIAIPTKKEKQ